jgi:hypothetical protein
MTTHTTAPTRQLLEWIASRPRTYAETMEAWRTHCPRLAVWDDAVIDGLVRVAGRDVLLTARGRALLDAEFAVDEPSN